MSRLPAVLRAAAATLVLKKARRVMDVSMKGLSFGVGPTLGIASVHRLRAPGASAASSLPSGPPTPLHGKCASESNSGGACPANQCSDVGRLSVHEKTNSEDFCRE